MLRPMRGTRRPKSSRFHDRANMAGAVSWQALIVVAGLIVFSGSAAFVSAYFTWRICLLIGALEKRITRLEMLEERRG